MGVSWVSSADETQAAVARIEREFSGVVAWYGKSTGAWWAMVRLGRGERLVEAVSPRELRDAIVHARGWPWPRLVRTESRSGASAEGSGSVALGGRGLGA